MQKGAQQWKEVIPYLLPGLFLFALFVLFPFFFNLYISFSEYNIMPGAEKPFVGFANYVKAFTDRKVGLSFRNTVLYSLVTVPGQMVLGILVAVFLNSIGRGKILFRTLYYIPVITSWIVVSLIFRYLFESGKAGLINYFALRLLGIKPISWLQNTWTANFVIWSLGIWKGIGWVMVVFLAGLQSVPKILYEAAEIDGAGFWDRFFKITLPLLQPVLFFLFVNLLIGSFNVFIQVLVITDGGPLGTTEVLLSYMYKNAFSFFEFGYASAQSVLMGIAIVAITFTTRRFFRAEVYEL
ncbi:MAG: sugar ABC transporter permease [Spirochaetes bacterium]|nr:MAG: sugar ABC transporter permease [Spirochaetota bacterium]